MPSVTLEVGALVIVLVERDAQPVVVEVDRPVQVLDFEEDLFDTNESHGPPPSSVQNGDLLELLHHRLMPLSFWVARFEPWPSLICASARSRAELGARSADLDVSSPAEHQSAAVG